MLIPLNAFHEIIVGYYLFKQIDIETALEFEEGRVIAKLLPMILNDFNDFGAIWLTIFLKNEEVLPIKSPGLTYGIKKSEFSPSAISWQEQMVHTHAFSADTICMQIS